MHEKTKITVTLTAPDFADAVHLADALFEDILTAVQDKKHHVLGFYEVSRVTVAYATPNLTHTRTEEL